MTHPRSIVVVGFHRRGDPGRPRRIGRDRLASVWAPTRCAPAGSVGGRLDAAATPPGVTVTEPARRARPGTLVPRCKASAPYPRRPPRSRPDSPVPSPAPPPVKDHRSAQNWRRSLTSTPSAGMGSVGPRSSAQLSRPVGFEVLLRYSRAGQVISAVGVEFPEVDFDEPKVPGNPVLTELRRDVSDYV